MKKYKKLMKRLSVEAAIAAVIAISSIAAMIVVSGFLDGKVLSQTALQSEVSGIQAEVAQTRDRIQSTGVSTKVYNQLKSSRETMSLVINRSDATEKLSALKDRFRLSSLNLQISPDTPIEDEKLKSAGLDAVKSSVDISLGGMSDQHLFSFIDALTHSFSGFVKIKEITLTRSKSFDIDSMREISRGSKPEMVNGKVSFEWFGVPYKESK